PVGVDGIENVHRHLKGHRPHGNWAPVFMMGTGPGQPISRLMDEPEIRRAGTRIAHEILERNKGAEGVVLVGIAARGDDLARRLAAEIARIEGTDVPVGALDITFYRDDIGMRSEAPEVHETKINFDITGRTVVLGDAV